MLNFSNQLQGQLNAKQKECDMVQSKTSDVQAQLNEQLRANKEAQAAVDTLTKELDKAQCQLQLATVCDRLTKCEQYLVRGLVVLCIA